MITASLLTISVVVELMLYGDMLGGGGFVFGATKRVVLSAAALVAYFYSFANSNGTPATQ